MTSKSSNLFDENTKDVRALLLFHEDEGGKGVGRRAARLEVLHKSAIVLITAFWEAFCEDLTEEALRHIVKHTNDASKLSKDIRKIIAKELESETHNLAVWKLSGDGWKKYLQDRFDSMREGRNRKLNTPKTAAIDELFEHTIGLKNLSSCWFWKRMPVVRASQKLDDFVSLRGEVAHRGAASGTCTKDQVTDYLNHITRIVKKTDARVAKFVKTTSGKDLS